MAFSDLAHSQLRSLYGLSTGDVTHVTLDTRPSRFSACNIEKLGVAWGRGYFDVVWVGCGESKKHIDQLPIKKGLYI